MADANQCMSRADTAWLRMDNDVTLVLVVGVWLLTPAITIAARAGPSRGAEVLRRATLRQVMF